MGFISTHLGIQVRLVVFCDLASNSGLHFATDSRGQVFANGIGHIAGSSVHQIFGRIRNGPAYSRIGNAISRHFALYGSTVTDLAGYRSGALVHDFICNIADGPIGSRIGNICRSLFHQSSIGSVSHLAVDAVQFLFYRRGFRIVGVIDFLEDGVHFLPEGRCIAIGIRHYITGFCCRLGSHVGLVSVLYGIGHTVLVVRTLAHGRFCIGRRVVASIRKFLADAVGGNSTPADGIIVLCPHITASFIEGRGTGLCFAGRRIHFQIHGLGLAASDGGVVVFIQLAGQGLGVEFAINRQILIHRQIPADGGVACRFQCTRLDIASLYCAGRLNRAVTSIEASGSNLTVGIYLEGAVGCAQGACRLQIAVAVDGSIAISRFHSTVAVNGEFPVCRFHAAVGAQSNLAISCFHAAIAVDCEFAVRCFD